MGIKLKDSLMHIGMPKRSGRYPYGSGGDPYQRTGDFVSRVNKLKKQNPGMTQLELAKAFGLKNTNEYRIKYALATNEDKARNIETAKSKLSDKKSYTQIGREMGVNESTVRGWLKEGVETRSKKAQVLADFLREQVNGNGPVDVGVGVESQLNVSKERMKQALDILKDEGYEVFGGRVPQVTNPGKRTTLKGVFPPGSEPKDIFKFQDGESPLYLLKDVTDYKVREDANGNDVVEKGFVYPKSMDSKRVMIRYDEDGGTEKDGVIEFRRNVPDLNMGNSRYAQVRVLVDDSSYMKGMALYSDDMPPGVDAIFNSNKPRGTPLNKVLKDIKRNSDGTPAENPFGSLIKEKGGQSTYIDENGNAQLSLINKRAEEGDWGEWANKLPAQFLSKQPKQLINRQLTETIKDKQAEFDDIKALTNPTVKKDLLEGFADDCDAASVHLKAAALPRQKYQVIIPVTTLSSNEVYAPNYDDGETVALVRFPHGGLFEIPILTVNNKHSDSRKILGPDASDAVGINSKTAEQLSGADFDGDTVMVIPCNSSKTNIRIGHEPMLKDLKNFDHKMEFGSDGPPTIDAKGREHYFQNGVEFKPMRATNAEMGKISNLITDMTIKGAGNDELARAVKHSMVVIDAEKHKLNYKKSEEVNGIKALRSRYLGQYDEDGKYGEGASTLISKASSQQIVLKRQGSPKVNEKGKPWYDSNRPDGVHVWTRLNKKGEPGYDSTKPEGAYLPNDSVKEEYAVYKKTKDPTTGKFTYTDTGKTRIRTQNSKKMLETDDAYSLVSNYRAPQELAYAEYANKLKSFANEARKEILNTGKLISNPTAKSAYKEEVKSLNTQLMVALKNAPRERQAQLIANSKIELQKKDNPDITKKELKKLSQQALAKARITVGAKRTEIRISDKEWEAIQSGAISENVLKKILKNSNKDDVRRLATPRYTKQLSSGKIARIEAMQRNGHTNAQIAKAVNMPLSTVQNYIKSERSE